MSARNGGLMSLAPVIMAASNVTQAFDWTEASARLTHSAEVVLNDSQRLDLSGKGFTNFKLTWIWLRLE